MEKWMWQPVSQSTFGCLLDVRHCLEGGAGQGIGLLGCSRLGDLFPEGLGQTTLEKLPTRSELLIILGVFRGLAAAVVKDGDDCGRLAGLFLWASWRPFGACGRDSLWAKETLELRVRWEMDDQNSGLFTGNGRFSQNIVQTAERFCLLWRHLVLQANNRVLLKEMRLKKNILCSHNDGCSSHFGKNCRQ